MELTWLGWVFLIDLGLSALWQIGGGLIGNDQVREPNERMLIGFFGVLYIIGFLTIGFVK